LTGKAYHLKNSIPDRGVLLICLIATVLIAIFGGLLISAESANPIETFMFFFRDGMTVPENTEKLEHSGEVSDEPTFIVPDITYNEQTSGDSVTVPDATLAPETTRSPETSAEQTVVTTDRSETTVKSPDTTKKPETTKAPDTTKKPETTKAPDTTKKPETTKTPETTRPAPVTSPSTTAPQSDEDYFSDALFLGDSRTVGFYLYARIPGATYFARTSMNVYNAFDKKVSETSDTASYDLAELLTKKKFGKIYILLGINEIGYSYTSIVSNYSKIIDYIKQYQPDAKIIIQSNMHVTKKKSEDSSFLSNPLIDELNLKISRFADNKKVFYLDFEEIFDGADGAMSPEYSGDGVHLYGKCYKLWLDWMLENGKIY
jgi:lysophospholipase L1-like esterase